jgi:hypothetical protein
MTRAIGFRVEPKALHWAVVEGATASPTLIAIDKISAPKTFSEPKILSFFRERVLHLIAHHHPDKGGVRYAEPNAQTSDPC